MVEELGKLEPLSARRKVHGRDPDRISVCQKQPPSSGNARAVDRLLPSCERVLGAASARCAEPDRRRPPTLWSAAGRNRCRRACRSFRAVTAEVKVSANRLVAGAEIGTAAALVLFGLAREPVTAVAASVVAGVCWIAALSSLNVSAQLALPDWVRARGLAMYVTVFFGTMTVGSVVWGELAAFTSLTSAQLAAAATAFIAALATSRWKLQTGTGPDLTPSMHWPEPVVTHGVAHDAGPVMVTVEYRIDVKDRQPFLLALNGLAAERRRDGAYAWGVFQDTADAGPICRNVPCRIVDGASAAAPAGDTRRSGA